MSKNAIGLLLLILFAAVGVARNSVDPGGKTSPLPAAQSAQTPSAYSNAQVPAGTELRAVLDTPLSTRISKPGDRFTATVSEPVRASDGRVVVPVGARIEGEVADTPQGRIAPALRGKGQLSLRFRDLVLPNGQTLPFAGTLVSVNSTSGKKARADEEGSVRSGTQGKDVAKDVGVGAGLGTDGGSIFGGPMKGLAIGAQAGGGYVLATQGKEVNLPAQTGLVIRLDQPLSMPAPAGAALPPR